MGLEWGLLRKMLSFKRSIKNFTEDHKKGFKNWKNIQQIGKLKIAYIFAQLYIYII